MRRQRASIVWYSCAPVDREAERAATASLNDCSSSRVTRSHASMKFGRETWRGGSLRCLRAGLREHEVRARRARSDRSGRGSSSGRGARSAGRCRPSRSGRRRSAPHALVARQRGRCACSRTRGPGAASPTPSAAACRSRRSRRAAAPGRSGRCPSPARPRPSAAPPRRRRSAWAAAAGSMRAKCATDSRVADRESVAPGVKAASISQHAIPVRGRACGSAGPADSLLRPSRRPRARSDGVTLGQDLAGAARPDAARS